LYHELGKMPGYFEKVSKFHSVMNDLSMEEFGWGIRNVSS